MNLISKFLPLLANSKGLLNKKTISTLVVAVSLYQMFSPYGLGSEWGIPSYDTFYKEPRDVLVDRVEVAKDVQQETSVEFRSALEEFKAVTSFDGGDLEKKFNQLNAAFERSEAAAKKVSSRVDRVVGATNRLLEEWRDELANYHDANIKARAERQFDDTRQRAEEMIAAMRRAEQKTEPVLGAFRDQVLFLKHNLNSQAIASLESQKLEVEQGVEELIRDMEASIAEAETFIKSFS